MKALVVTTTYSNIDGPWLAWYIERLAQHPDLKAQARSLLETGTAVLENKDPTSQVSGKTVYEIREVSSHGETAEKRLNTEKAGEES